MIHVLLFSILGLILVMLVSLTYYFRHEEKAVKDDQDQEKSTSNELMIEKISISQSYVYAAIILSIIVLLLFVYLSVKGTPLEAHMMEWLNLVIRLMHITFGIAWIGASFYFVFLENALNRKLDVRDELAGNLWAIHGGGFYYLEKYKLAPKTIPRELHWFKYEAYFTWLSGFSLLFVVYYFNASGFLIDTNVLNISPLAAISTGIISFVIAWLMYDLLCKSPLINKGIWFAIVGFIILAGFAYFYSHVFSGRAAYIHFGAMIGSIMVANVFFVIIPAQKAMVQAARKGAAPDPKLGKNAGLRSLHNNYFTLPVLFVMISNHFPSTFASKNQWLILLVISVGTAGVKHYLNLREKGQYNIWIMPVSVLVLLAAVFMSAPQVNTDACKSKVSFAQVNSIVQVRCLACHSTHPTDPSLSAPPNGIVYDTPEKIVGLKDKIMQRVVVTKTMPQNNKTNMTDDERDVIRCWIQQGAEIK